MIQSPRCHFVPIIDRHFPEVIAMYGELDSNKYIRPIRELHPDKYVAFLQSKVKLHQSGEGYFWSVFNREHGFIGTANFNQFASLNIEHVGIHLSRSIWGQGFGKEIGEALCRFAKSAGRSVVHAIIEEGNLASIRIFEGLGFRLHERKEISGDDLRIYKLDLDAQVY